MLDLTYMKGIMIFLVVFGHLIGDYKANHVVHTEWHLIYLFHMPVLVFILGCFLK